LFAWAVNDMLFVTSPILTRAVKRLPSLVWGFAAVLAVCGAQPARADVTEIMREIQRTGSARVIVTMKNGEHAVWSMAQPATAQREAVAALSANVTRRMSAAAIPVTQRYITLPYVGAVVNAAQLQALASMPEVAAVNLVEIQRRQPTPVLSSVERQKASTLDAAMTAIGAPDVWVSGYEGQGLTVAVIDGGFNVNHPMLRGKNVGDACFAETIDAYKMKAQCPSGATPQIGAGAASYCPAGNTRCDHGTHVTSIAVGNDGTNFGVARGAKFMPIDVYSASTDPDTCGPDPMPCEVTSLYAVLNALDYINENAAAYNVAAVNYSSSSDSTFSGYCDDDLRKTAMDNLRAKGIAVMVAAGNAYLTGSVGKPACVSTAEAVGMTDNTGAVDVRSNFATMVDMMAPGVNISAASGSGSGFQTMSGTSMAAPHAAGAFTLLRTAFPTATANEISQALKSTGTAVTRVGAGFSVPLIHVSRALSTLAGYNRQLLSQIISVDAKTLGQSFLRVYNGSSVPGTVTLTFRDAVTGTRLGTWTSAPIPAQASPQLSVAAMEQQAVPAENQVVAASGRSYYNIEATSTFNGYVQYVLWADVAGMLGNMTSCPAGVSTDRTTLLNVHASAVADYTSHIRIVNSGTIAGRPTLTFSNSTTGQVVAQWTSSSIPAGATLDVTMPQLETQVPELTGLNKAVQYTVTVKGFAGYLQHVLQNRISGVLTDMSAKCTITAAN